MKFKKVLGCALVLTMILTNSLASFADEQYPELSSEEVENDLVNLNSQEMIESRTLSYDEMVEVLVEDGYTKEEAIKQLGLECENSYNRQAYSSSRKKYMEFKTSKPVLSKGKKHKIYLYAYCEYTSWGPYGGIKSIEHVRVDAGKKAFKGKVYYKLESPLRIYFSVSGELYSSGSTTISGGGQASVGQGKTVNFNISRAKNFYDTVSGSTYYSRNR
ncbi:hypothetical protein FYJ27_09510 [Anaerosalibacter bizertensis]|uniref:Uncharacterized protein n=1 Tax=Anaerosalibacter bizertensis TaxID=932217 RepID=A0A844FJ38_9FIRM|nr:hypothetical protein [Anaerosalibacter bizertensis]MSS43962.1 hypothetical protein [Anaerosalibacter bizertensis]